MHSGRERTRSNNQPTEQINQKNQAQALTVTNPKKWKTLKPNHQDYLRNRGESLSKTASPSTESLKPTLIWLKTVKTEEKKSEGVKDEG
jgi:hypothetical protein